MKKLLKMKDAAEQLGVPEASLRAVAARHGFLIRIGNAVRIDPDDLTALVEACKVPAQQTKVAIRPETDHNQTRVTWTKGAGDVVENLRALGKKRKISTPRQE